MLPHEPGLRLSVGVSGAGKTFGIRREIETAARTIPVMVMDRMCEWQHGDAGVHSVAEGAAAAEQGARLIVVRPADIVTASVEACAWAARFSGAAGVAIPEAHRVAPNGGRLPGPIDDAACQWRHHGIALWLDTQRLAKLHKDLTEQAAACELRLYAVVGEHDLATVREIGGRELQAAVRQCAKHFAAGEKGYHVRIGPGAMPPYRVERS